MATDNNLIPLARLMRHLLPSARSVYEAFKYSPGQSRDNAGRFSSGGSFSTGATGITDVEHIGGIPRSELNDMSSADLQDRGFIPVYRGTGPAGLERIRETQGQLGYGVYFYADATNASAYAEPDGGIVTGFVHPSTVEVHTVPGSALSREHKVVVLPNADNFIRRGTIYTDETKDPANLSKLAKVVLDEDRYGKPIQKSFKYAPGQARDTAGRFGSNLGGGGGVSPGGMP